MGFKVQPAVKRADTVGTHTSREAKNIEGRHHQAQKPPMPFFGVPQPRLWVAVSAFHGLFETMHAALGKPGALGNLTNALRRVVTKSVENPKAFGPKSPVGWSSDR